jgi:hypothetical protein
MVDAISLQHIAYLEGRWRDKGRVDNSRSDHLRSVRSHVHTSSANGICYLDRYYESKSAEESQKAVALLK